MFTLQYLLETDRTALPLAVTTGRPISIKIKYSDSNLAISNMTRNFNNRMDHTQEVEFLLFPCQIIFYLRVNVKHKLRLKMRVMFLPLHLTGNNLTGNKDYLNNQSTYAVCFKTVDVSILRNMTAHLNCKLNWLLKT